MTTPSQKLQVDRVLIAALAVLLKHLWPFLLLAALASLPTLYMDLALPDTVATVTGEAVPPGTGPATGATTEATAEDLPIAVGALLFVAIIVTSTFFSGIVAHMTVAELRGSRVGLREAVAGTLPAYPAIFAAFFLIFLMLLGVAFAAAIFWAGIGLIAGGPTSPAALMVIPIAAVPAALVMATFYVVIPAIVTERISALQSLRRSEELTKGDRGRIVLLAVVIFAVIAAVNGAMYLLKVLLLGPGAVYTVLNYVAGLPVAALSWIAIAVAYVFLRTAREGAAG
jgi:hypothetical protein